MKLDKNSWHYRIFVFNSQMVATMRHYEAPHLHPVHGKLYGLCPYMRMILVWGPVVLLMNILPMLCMLGALFVLPVMVIGGISTLYTGLMILAVIGGCFAVFCGVSYLGDVNTAHQHKKNILKRQQDRDGVVPPDKFWSLLTGYLKSAKTKVCPVLEFDDE